jgi:hypothetical protein
MFSSKNVAVALLGLEVLADFSRHSADKSCRP